MEWTKYTTKTALKDNDELMILDKDANANKRTLLDKVWDYVVNKMTTAVIAKLGTTNKTLIGAVNELNSNELFNDYLFYRSSGANIKSITISINKNPNNALRYAPFVMFGGNVFLTGLFGSVKTLDASSQVLVNYQVSGMNEEVVFSNLPNFSNVVIIANYKNIATATVKEES
jgi:hypothetical protein